MFLKPIVEYETYKASLSKLNKAKLKFENMQKLSEESQKISDNLSSTLGISKIGEQIDFDQIDKVEKQAKIKSREVKIAEKEYLKAEEKLKETIVGIKELRRTEAEIIGKSLMKKALKLLKDVEKLRSDYALLYKDIGADLSERDKIDFGSEETIIGPDLRYVDWSNRKQDRTRGYLKRVEKFDETAKMYAENRRIAEEEIKEIKDI